MEGLNITRSLPLRLILLVGAIITSGCVNFAHRDDDSPGRAEEKKVEHVVERGETLFSIAWQQGEDYREVAKWNGIRRPYTIYPGQRIRLVAPASRAAKAVRVDDDTDDSPPVKTSPKKTKPIPVRSDLPVQWRWPVEGPLLSTFSSTDVSRRGIDIGGKSGQAVFAAAGGYVVYAGSGLRGYGNLVIVKHNETFYSAYAHNQLVVVKENEKVKSGQHIADMGKTGTDRVMLHFEIRKDGKPIDPLRYLPKRK